MGHCISCIRRNNKKITVLMLGLDNAGKTCTAKCLLKEPRDDVAPTVGFSSVKPRLTRAEVTVYDLGGGHRIRPIWRNYFPEAFGIIFVIDAADVHRFAECKTTLNDLMRNEQISGKPALILANKQDSKDAVDEADICDKLGLEAIVNDSKCRTKIETCSATAFGGKKIDRAILKGYLWLIDTILADYDALHTRVEKDTLLQKLMQEKERRAREERVRKIREERQRTEEGCEREQELDRDKGLSSDPFRPISEIQKELEKEEEESRSSSFERKELDLVFVPTEKQTSLSSTDWDTNTHQANGFVSDSCQEADTINAIFEEQNKPKKKKRFIRNNKTAPLETTKEFSTGLPPLQFGPNGQSRQGRTMLEPISRFPSDIKHSWGLADELEPVEAKQLPLPR